MPDPGAGIGVACGQGGWVAQAYGEHPEIAAPRMCWARTAVASAFG
jgi:hypothetical protein